MSIKSINPIVTQMLVILTAPQSNSTIVTDLIEELYDVPIDDVEVVDVDDGNLVVLKSTRGRKFPTTFLVNQQMYPNVIVSFVG